jgi:hypothetical protein
MDHVAVEETRKRWIRERSDRWCKLDQKAVEGAMDQGAVGGAMDQGAVEGAMDQGAVEGAMDQGAFKGAMDQDAVEGTCKRLNRKQSQKHASDGSGKGAIDGASLIRKQSKERWIREHSKE